mmetsp:Transcript_13874/g.23108  ORF Transcript_13874/g.23108 Transcript_13874/m.23108 type:complete len:155 (+) Transcript_13874:63-527(+)|eukprot:CAMPEP_0174981418 /NCGR_PEP_ID=MMETSP0004_2-20121128/15880_1 /TAXON_ID=420556 /ORGANISM="Ochromonas sp., Strain CCMP1393" /LENGTH=154 /DNA_ID=CAMNT_0016233163 /DNA_START=47 /DNA_END=511 /DNA_ORIENTATION=-
MEGDSSEDRIVEEFPPPPLYYRCFIDEKYSLDQPSIPEDDPYKNAYNGIFAIIKDSQLEFRGDRDYKVDLKRILKEIMESALLLVSNNDPSISNIDQSVINLREKLTEFHAVLNEYRLHEAREVLCMDTMVQLQRVQEIEKNLQRALEKAKSAL